MPHFTLPPDRITDSDSGGRAFKAEIPPELVQKIHRSATAEGHSLFEYFLTTFVAWLGSESHRSEIGLGVGIANRVRPEFRETLGMFVNMVTLRMANSPTPPSWGTLRQLVAAELRDAWPHQHVPFEETVRAVNPPRETGRHPLFDVLFSMHQRHPRIGWFDNTVWEYEEALDNGTSKFDLTVFLICEPALQPDDMPRVWVRWEFRTDRFSESSMAARFEQFQALLREALTDSAPASWTTPGTGQISSAPDAAAPEPLTGRTTLKAEPTGTEPPDGWTQTVIAVWQPFFPGESIGAHTDFFAIGGHSLLSMEVVIELERVFDREIPVNIMLDAPTPELLAQRLLATDDTRGFGLSPLNRTQGPPVVFVHGWGGEVFGYHRLAGKLETRVFCYGLHASPQLAFKAQDLETLAAAYADYLIEKLPDQDFTLAGYSAGGTFAWAVACALEDRGKKPQRLIIIDSRPYRLPLGRSLWVHRRWIPHRIAERMAELRRQGWQHAHKLAHRMFRTLVARSQIHVLQKKAQDVSDYIPPDASVDPFQTLAGDWKPRRLSVPISVIQSRQTPLDLRSAWRAWTSLPVDVQWVDPAHLALLKEPAIDSVADAVVEALKFKN